MIHVKQVMIDRLQIDLCTQLAGRIAILRQRAIEGHVLIEVVVVPLPLIPGNLDGHVRRAGVVHLDQHASGRNRHHDQNGKRDDRPDQFDRGVFMKMGRLGARGFAVPNDRIEHCGEDQCTDRHTDPEHRHMQIMHAAADLGDTFGHVVSHFGMRTPDSH